MSSNATIAGYMKRMQHSDYNEIKIVSYELYRIVERSALKRFLTINQNLLLSCIRINCFMKKNPAYYLLSIVLSFCMLSSFGQSIEIKGKVQSVQKEVLEGVTVLLKGTKFTAVTQADGSFTIKVPDNKARLVFSYTGYASLEQPVGNQTFLTVFLKDSVAGLNDVVVVGYGSVKRKDVTGSLASVNMADMNKAPVRSFDEALAGRVAGVQVTSSDGQPGAGINIVIRGANSISQDNSPLYVIDGFPIEGANNNTINPQDIETFDVLKDASATAIYGARGANGVIIITTKKGKTGPPVVSLNSYYGVQKATKLMELMSPYEFVKYQLEYNTNRDPFVTGSGATPTPYQLYLSGGTTMDYYKDTAQAIDWQNGVLRTAGMLSNSLSVNGGNDRTKYAVSGSVFNQDGILINSNYKRYQGRVVLDQKVNDKLKVGINANYSYLLQAGMSPGETNNSATSNIMYSVWGYRPVSPSKASQQAIGVSDQSANSYTDQDVSSTNDYRFNPIINLQNLVRNKRTTNIVANAYAEYTIVPNLVLRVTGGINSSILRNEQFNSSKTSYGNSLLTSSGANGSIVYNESSTWLNENYLTYNKRINKDHQLNVVAGVTEQGNKTSAYGTSAILVPNEKLGTSGLSEGTPLSITSTSSLWTAASFLARVNYSFKSKYLFTASYRADGSSRFSADNHWGYFPSGAFAWKFTDEKFMKSLHAITDGKLRVSYGNTANNRVSDFAYLATYSQSASTSSVYTFNNTPITGAVPATIGNDKLKWETTSQVDIGLDLSLLKDRINLTADVYRKTTKDLLLNASLPTSTGYSTVFKNIGSVRNQGLELTLGTVNVQGKNFSWNSSFNISFNGNKVLGLSEGQETLLSTIAWDNSWSTVPAYIAKIGKPLGLMYGYVWDGVYQYSDFNKTTAGTYILKDNVTTNGNARASIQPGDIKYKDLNGDKVVNTSDYTVIGRGLPVHTGGFTNNFTYKGFDLSVFFQWSYGNDIQNTNNLVFSGNALGRSYFNQFSSYQNRWTATNTNTDQFRVGGYYGGGYSSRTVENGSYLRLKTVSLGYNLPQPLLTKWKVKALRLYASAQNLFTITGYSGQDPEVNTYNSVLTGGFDYSAYPRARTVTVGINASF